MYSLGEQGKPLLLILLDDHNMRELTLITPPATEPVTLAELKNHCRVDSGMTDDDSLLTGMGISGRQYAESYTGRQLITATYELRLPDWPLPAYLNSWNTGRASYANYNYPWNWARQFPQDFKGIVLPKSPAIAISTVKYLDADGSLQTLSSAVYRLALSTESYSVLIFDDSANLPVVKPAREDAVRIQFTAGYGDATVVPESIKCAIRLFAGELYNKREESSTGNYLSNTLGIDRLLSFYRVMEF